MGFYRELAITQHERSCGTVDGWVCAECFDDYAIRAFVDENASENECSYCGRSAEEPIAADADDVASLIMEGIKTEWVDPGEESPFESAEGGYLWDTIEFEDVLEQAGSPIVTSEFQQALTVATCDHTYRWCKRDYVAPHLDEAMSYDWQRLVELVKWRSRYFFILDDEVERHREAGQANSALEILKRIGSEAEEAGLIRTLDAGTPFWRVRRHAASESFDTATELGTVPPAHSVGSNRMSPAGMPAFYGCSDLETALAEVGDDGTAPAWSAGHFKISEDCLILDLVDIEEPPSLFDRERGHLARPLMFFRQFAEEVSKPLEPGNREQIDYVPTQVVAEYLRRSFVSAAGPIDGIRYKSAQAPDGVCLALFIDNEQCVDEGVEGVLSLVLDSTDHS